MSALREVSGPVADPSAVLDERARALARPADRRGADGPGVLHVVVRVGPQRVAAPATGTLRCSPPRPLASLPGAAWSAVLALASVDGSVVPVADLAQLLEVPTDLPMSARPLLVVDDGAQGLALLVDELDGLIDLDVAPSAEAGALTSTAGSGVRLLHIDAVLAAIATTEASPPPDQPGARS